jgi:hypothetical protein
MNERTLYQFHSLGHSCATASASATLTWASMASCSTAGSAICVPRANGGKNLHVIFIYGDEDIASIAAICAA